VATNENDILARFWRSGRYEKVDSTSSLGTGTDAAAPAGGASDGKQATADASGVKETLSPAMDILVSSNFERLLWYLAYESSGSSDREAACKMLDAWMASVKSDGRAVVPTAVLELARRDFIAERVSNEQTLEAIRDTFHQSKYVADPHTAVGLAAAKRLAPHNPPSTFQIVLSTAHPAKFSDAVTQALSTESSFNFDRDVLPEDFRGLLAKEKRVVDVEAADVDLVKHVIDEVAQRLNNVANVSV